MVGQLAALDLEAVLAVALEQADHEAAAAVALAEEVVADVGVASRVDRRHRVEVEGARVQLLEPPERQRSTSAAKRSRSAAAAGESSADEPTGVAGALAERGRRVVEQVGEQRDDLRPRVGAAHGHHRRSGALVKPKPASCLRVNGSTSWSIATSRVIGGST